MALNLIAKRDSGEGARNSRGLPQLSIGALYDTTERTPKGLKLKYLYVPSIDSSLVSRRRKKD